MSLETRDFVLTETQRHAFNACIARRSDDHSAAGKDAAGELTVEFTTTPFGSTVVARFDGAVDAFDLEQDLRRDGSSPDGLHRPRGLDPASACHACTAITMASVSSSQ